MNAIEQIVEIRPCIILKGCTVVDFKDHESLHSGQIQDVRPSELSTLPSLRSE